MLFTILFWGACIGGVIYYAIKQAEAKKNETFEDRDN